MDSDDAEIVGRYHQVHDTPGFEADPDYTGGYVHEEPQREENLDRAKFDQMVSDLAAAWGCGENQELIEELITTSLKLGEDESSEGELKLINRALKEIRRANNIFRHYRRRRKVAVFGSARLDEEDGAYQTAREFAERISERDFMTITGAGPGIMAAANRGAGTSNSFGLQIRLPFEEAANPWIDKDEKLIRFNYFFTRKLFFVKEAHAVVLFPGGFGTMDEAFEVMTLIQTGKAAIYPIVMVDEPGGSYWKAWLQFIREHLGRLKLISEEDFNLFRVVPSVDDAIEEVTRFYRVFNSYRYVKKQLVIRLNRALTPEAVLDLNERFSDLLLEGDYVLGNALPEEKNEPIIYTLPRLICMPKRSNYGRMRQLIDAINESEVI